MTRRTTVVASLLAALVALAVLAGCGSDSQSAEQQTQTKSGGTTKTATPPAQAPAGAGKRCLVVSDGLVSRIQSHVVLEGGHLRHVRAVASPEVPGLYFISAHVVGGGAGKKMVATWASQSLKGDQRILAVDDSAALVSTFGSIYSSSITAGIKTAGAFKSRVCAFGPGAPHGGPAPPSGVGTGNGTN